MVVIIALLLGFSALAQTTAPYISRLPIDPTNSPAADHPTCSKREDPPRTMPDNYLDLVYSTDPLPEQAYDPVSGTMVDQHYSQSNTWSSTLPFPWTQLVIECQATDAQWAQIIVGLGKLTAPLAISGSETGQDCPVDGSGMYYAVSAGIFRCVPPGGPILDPPPWQFRDTSHDIPNPTPDTVPLSACIFGANQSQGMPIYRDANGQFSFAPTAHYWDYWGVEWMAIRCDGSLGYALMMPDYETTFDLVKLAPFRLGATDPTDCLAYGADWFYNTTTERLKQCSTMLTDNALQAEYDAYWAANPRPPDHPPQDPPVVQPPLPQVKRRWWRR